MDRPVNILIESEQRVGSRWLHYMLANLYARWAAPEIDGHHVIHGTEYSHERIQHSFNHDLLVKLHHISVSEICDNVKGNYKIVSIGRSPRDRAVSVAFHHMYDTAPVAWPQRGMTEEEAIRYTILEYDRYPISTKRMLDNMIEGHSTRDTNNTSNHIWTTYEWHKEDTVKELKTIGEFIGRNSFMSLEDAVLYHSFELVSEGRSPGEEDRKNIWARKGIVGDWHNWLDDELIEATEDDHLAYAKKNSVVLKYH